MKFLRNQLVPVLLLLAFSAKATVYNVSPAGAGLASLTGAVNNAALTVGPHTINLAAGTYTLANALTFGNLANQNISFIGAGAGSTTITVSGIDRIMNIGDGSVSGVATSVQGITFSNTNFGNDIYGGGAIIAGGPGGGSLTVTNCIFNNCKVSAVQGIGDGGAISMQGGGALNVTGCTFTNNSVAVGQGGAIDYFMPSNAGVNGSMNVTGNTFTNNGSANGTSGGGGAVHIAAQAAVGGQTFSAVVQKNNFTLNHADGANGTGGAVRVDNSFSAANTVDLRFNRFAGNIALGDGGTNTAVAVAATDGSVNASNCWWGCNTGSTACADKAKRFTGGAGVLTVTPYLTLTNTATNTALCNAAPNNTSVITASFLVNSAGTTLTTSDISALIGLPVTFNAGAAGSISGAQTTIQASGTATATYTATTGSGAGGTATVDAGTTTSAIAVTASTLPTTAAATTVTQAVGTNSNVYRTACSFIATVLPTGATPISGNVTAKVWVETTVPKVNGKPFVARHYEITPAAGASTATGTVTLYFTQAEFNAFNADPLTTLDLPTGAADNGGKANLRIGKFGGTSSNGSGMPGTYSNGYSSIIDPPDANIVFNSAVGRWEVTFDVAGFSGFVVQTLTTVIPVRIASFTGKLNADKSASLYWNVENQLNVDKYIVEKSTDRINFTDIGTVQANTLSSAAYTFRDPAAGSGNVYYRIRIADADARTSHSDILVLNTKNDQSVFIYPNPVAGSFTLQTTAAYINESATLLDANGRVIKTVKVTGTLQTVNMEGLAKGLYLLRFTDGNTYKITKQ